MKTTGKPTRRPRGLPGSYIGMWLLLLTLSILYLSGVALKPELMAEILPPVRIVEPESNEGQRSAARALAEAQTLRLELERSQVALAEARAELATRIAQEPKPAPIVEAAAAPAPSLEPARPEVNPPAPAAKPPVAPRADKGKAAKQAALDPKVESQAHAGGTGGATYLPPGRILNSPAEPAQITTGSVNAPATVAAAAQAAPIFGPPTITPAKPVAAGPQGIQLASGPSLDALRLSWVLLTERHGGALKGLEPRYVAGNDAAGKSFDLIAGPLPTPEEAAKVCAGLRAKKVACAVSPFMGNAL